ncbi:hypothetical protein LM597_03040 [Candidatus Acetothermia bacterium]|nr:hypothetical protein [Candidatus Acetothermia bacterium]
MMGYLALVLFTLAMAAAAIAAFPAPILMGLSLLLAVLWGANEFYFRDERINSLLFVLGAGLLALAILITAIDILAIGGLALALVAWDISLFYREISPYLASSKNKESNAYQQSNNLGKRRLMTVAMLSGIGLLIGGAARTVRVELPFIHVLLVICVAIVSLTLILRLASRIYPPPPVTSQYRRKSR